MLVLGLQGSPRKKGNSNFLLDMFVKTAENMGAHTHIVDVTRKNIIPCKEYVVCEKKDIVRLRMTSEMRYIHCCGKRR